MENGPGLKMYFLLEKVDIPASYVRLPEGISFNWSLFGLKELRDYDVTVVDMHVPSFSVGVKCHNQGTSDRWRNDRPKSTQIWMDSLCSLHFSFLQTIKKLLNINELNSPWMRGKLKKSLFWHPFFFGIVRWRS